MAKAGLLGSTGAPEHGGAGADFLSYALAIEEIAAADGGVSNVMAATNSPVAVAVEENGTDQQKSDYLSRITKGDWIGCILLTEPHTGSDAAAIRTRANWNGDHFLLNGDKAFITAGSTAELAMIVAVTDPNAGKKGITTFITPTNNPGYKVIRKETKLGHRTNDTCQVRFEDMRVPATDVLGEPGSGLRIARSKLSEGRIAVAAQAVGGARAALKAAYAYAKFRKAFGKYYDTETLSFPFTCQHCFDDATDNTANIHYRTCQGIVLVIGILFCGAVGATNIFDTNDQTGLTCNSGTVSPPAGTAPHCFREKIRLSRFGIKNKIANF